MRFSLYIYILLNSKSMHLVISKVSIYPWASNYKFNQTSTNWIILCFLSVQTCPHSQSWSWPHIQVHLFFSFSTHLLGIGCCMREKSGHMILIPILEHNVFSLFFFWPHWAGWMVITCFDEPCTDVYTHTLNPSYDDKFDAYPSWKLSVLESVSLVTACENCFWIDIEYLKWIQAVNRPISEACIHLCWWRKHISWLGRTTWWIERHAQRLRGPGDDLSTAWFGLDRCPDRCGHRWSWVTMMMVVGVYEPTIDRRTTD